MSILNAAIAKLQTMEQTDQVQTAIAILIHHELDEIISNTPLAELFPFKKNEVEKIIKTAWKNRTKQK